MEEQPQTTLIATPPAQQVEAVQVDIQVTAETDDKKIVGLQLRVVVEVVLEVGIVFQLMQNRAVVEV